MNVLVRIPMYWRACTLVVLVTNGLKVIEKVHYSLKFTYWERCSSLLVIITLWRFEFLWVNNQLQVSVDVSRLTKRLHLEEG